MKNGDRIRQMNNGELAIFLCSLFAECGESGCPVQHLCAIGKNGFLDWVNGDDFDAIYGDYQDDKG